MRRNYSGTKCWTVTLPFGGTSEHSSSLEWQGLPFAQLGCDEALMGGKELQEALREAADLRGVGSWQAVTSCLVNIT